MENKNIKNNAGDQGKQDPKQNEVKAGEKDAPKSGANPIHKASSEQNSSAKK